MCVRLLSFALESGVEVCAAEEELGERKALATIHIMWRCNGTSKKFPS